MLPKEDINYQTKTRMLEQVVVMLGGRMAEKLVLGDISTGASNVWSGPQILCAR